MEACKNIASVAPADVFLYMRYHAPPLASSLSQEPLPAGGMYPSPSDLISKRELFVLSDFGVSVLYPWLITVGEAASAEVWVRLGAAATAVAAAVNRSAAATS